MGEISEMKAQLLTAFGGANRFQLTEAEASCSRKDAADSSCGNISELPRYQDPQWGKQLEINIMPQEEQMFGRFDVNEIAKSFPETSDTLPIHTYVSRYPAALHATCDEYLYVISGRGTFWIEDVLNAGEFAPGHLLFFERGTVHALPEILEGSVVFLSVDTPRRDPKDIIFVNPEGGTPETFIHQK
jgi:mannose-6-phosphate isomerase-like protein (cupin superfamily)